MILNILKTVLWSVINVGWKKSKNSQLQHNVFSIHILKTKVWTHKAANGLHPKKRYDAVLPDEEVFEKFSVLFNPTLPPAVRKVKHHPVKHTAPERGAFPQPRAVHLEKHRPT